MATFNHNYEKAKAQFKNTLMESFTTQKHDEFPTNYIGGIGFDEDSGHNVQQQIEVVMLTPEHTATNTYKSLQNVQFDFIPSDFHGRILRSVLRLILQSSTAVDLNIGRMQNFVFRNSRGEIGENIGATKLYYFDGALEQDRDKANTILENMNTNDQYQIGMYSKKLTAATDYEYYIDFQNFLTASGFPIFALKNGEKITLEIMPNNATSEWCVSGVYSNISVTKMELYLTVAVTPQEIKESYIQKYINEIHHFSYPNIIDYNVSETLTASTKKGIELSSLHGFYAGIYMGIRPTKTTYYSDNFAQMDDCVIQLTDKTNNSIGNSNGLTVKQYRNMMMNSIIGKKLAKNSNIIIIPFSDNLDDILTGKNRGYRYLDGTDKAWLTPPATNNAETARVLTLKTYLETTAVANVATNGYVTYTYSSLSGSSSTIALAFNETNANLDIWLNKLAIKDNLIISTATGVDDAAGLICTISNLDQYYKKWGNVDTIQITATGCLHNATPAGVIAYTVETTAGSPRLGLFGASGGTYDILFGGIRMSKVVNNHGQIYFLHG
jgi:hypothetical protein